MEYSFKRLKAGRLNLRIYSEVSFVVLDVAITSSNRQQHPVTHDTPAIVILIISDQQHWRQLTDQPRTIGRSLYQQEKTKSSESLIDACLETTQKGTTQKVRNYYMNEVRNE